MQVKFNAAYDMVAMCIRAGVVPLIEGSPAIGKSSIAHKIAKDFNLKIIDLRLSQCDPTDLLGFPHIEENTKKARYIPMETFPLEGDPLPYHADGKTQYAGWLLLLDELTSAPRGVQAASYKLILDRQTGTHNLHRNVAIVAAGNMETDGAIVETMSTALQSRMIHFELVVDLESWCNWAADNAIDHRIVSYVRFKPGDLYNFKPDHTDKTYASPRTWEFADRLIKVNKGVDRGLLPLLAGTISEGVAMEFLTFCEIFDTLPRIDQITAAPDTFKVPVEPSILFALTGSLAHHMTVANLPALMKYLNRMPAEFQVVCLRESVRRNKDLMSQPTMQDWFANTGAAMF